MPLLSSAVEVPWKHSSMVYSAKGKPVRQMLLDIAATQPFSVVVDGGVRGEVRGDFNDPARRVFESIVDAYDLVWFFDGSVLYVSAASDSRAEVVQTVPLAPAQALQSLRRLGLADARFPIRVSRGALLVTGPSRYIDLVSKAVAAERGYADAENESRRVASADGLSGASGDIERRRVMVFPLSHAQAADTVLHAGDTEQVVPGVATILRSLLDGESPSWRSDMKDGMGRSRERRRVHGVLSENEPVQTVPQPMAQRTDGARVEPDRRTNAVLVYDVPSTRAYYQETIAALDRPGRLVRLDVAIIDIDSAALRDLGIDLGISSHRWNGQTVPSLGSGGAQFQGVIGGGATKLTARLAALEQVGKAKIMSRPSIHTLDNVPAVIGNQSTAYARVAGAYANDLFPITAGLRVDITPQIVPGESARRQVRLAIDVRDGRLGQAGEVDGLPVSTDNFVSTEARVIDGDTLMFGGYRYEHETHQQSGVPGLRYMPVMGGLFRKTLHQKGRSERLFLVTPHIVDESRRDGVDIDAIEASDPGLALPRRPFSAKPEARVEAKRR